MSIDNSIKLAVSNVLKNPVLAVLKEINISKILKESNFIKRDIGYTPFRMLLHFIYMLVINKRQSAFIRHSSDAYKKTPITDLYRIFDTTGESYWRLVHRH